MSIEVVKAGLFTSIQDNGRKNYAAFGVPRSGAMDQYSAKIANLMVGNSEEKAVMESTMQGPLLKFNQDAFIALTGIEAKITINEHPVELNTAVHIKENDRLFIKRITQGFRVYMAVHGGFKTDQVLNSQSFCPGITKKEKLTKGDCLKLSAYKTITKKSRSSVKFNKARYTSPFIEAYKGPEWNELSKELQHQLLSKKFSISKNNNRQAYQLKEKLENELQGILTQPVLPGTVQFTPAGNVIILMRDCQTTGGYPRVLQLTKESIDKLAQRKAKEELRFEIKALNS